MKEVSALLLVGVFVVIGAGCAREEGQGRPEPPPVSTEPGPGMRRSENAGQKQGATPPPVPRGSSPEESPSNLRGYEEPKYQDPLQEDGG